MRLRRRSISLISSQITLNIFQHIHSIYTLLIQVLSSIITFQLHHGVTKLIHAGDSHSPFSYPKTRPSSLTSPALLIERDTRRPHLARPLSSDQSDRFPWARDICCRRREPTFPHDNQSGTWHSVQVRSDATSHITPNAIMNHKTRICYMSFKSISLLRPPTNSR